MRSFHGAVVGLLACTTSSSTVQQDTTGTSSLLERYALPSAVCADGSPGFYYMATNASSNDYVFRFMGGGGCANNETYCEEIRDISAPVFTSDEALWPPAVAGYNSLSGDEDENPLYSTYNRILVPYCTQDMFLLDTESSDGALQFRGRPYLEETLTTVLSGSSEGATAVLVGTSAGGVAAFNAASWLLDTFVQVSELSVVLESSFFFDVHGSLNDALEYMQRDPSVAYSSHCSEDFDGGPCCMQFGCMVQRGYYPSKDERLKGTFVVSPAQDILPGFFVDKSESTTAANEEEEEEEVDLTTLWDTAAYTGRAVSLMKNVASLFPAEISVFAPSCADHTLLVAASAELFMCFPEYEVPPEDEFYDGYSCAFEGPGGVTSAATYVWAVGDVGLRMGGTTSAGAWASMKIDGTSIQGAMERWWEGRGNPANQVFLFDECDDLNCNPTCQTWLLPGTREETESAVVRAVVLATFLLAVFVLAAGVAALAWGLRQGGRGYALVAAALEKGIGDGGVDGVSSAGLSDDGLLAKPTRRTRGTDDGGDRGSNPTAADVPVLEWKALSYWLPPSTRSFLRQPEPDAEPTAPSTETTGKTFSADGATPPPREKQLLRAMHGGVPRGSLCALMGPSGSGKSTLLDLLTGRRSFGRCEGEVLFEGRSVAGQQEAYISRSGYMRQGNTGYLDGLTVLENLVYAAMLRFPGTVEQQSRRVHAAVKQASLDRSAYTKAGDLSGGQKRRLKIALELLVDRQILFLDEPSSGLDAAASLELVTILKRLSKKVTIVVAIHQPRPEVWRLFDHAILLSGGRTVFCGPSDRALAATTRYLVSQAQGRNPEPGAGRLGGAPPANDDAPRNLSRAAPPMPAALVAPSAGPISPPGITPPREQDYSSSTPNGPARGTPRGVRVPAPVREPIPEPVLGNDVVVEGVTVIGRGSSESPPPSSSSGLSFLPRGGVVGAEDAESSAAGSHSLLRVRQIFQLKQWESDTDLCSRARKEPTESSGGVVAPEGWAFGLADCESLVDPGEHSPTAAGLAHDPRRTIPDKILDRLMMIANEQSGKPQADERKEEAPGFAFGGAQRTTANLMRVVPAGALREEPVDERASGNSSQEGGKKTAAWKVVAVLLARSCKGGYAREVASTSTALAIALVFIGVSLRLANQTPEGLMFHLVLSVLTVSMLPVLLVYSPVMIISMYTGWPLTKLEIADGFYPPWCATARYVIDHFAVGVFISFAEVCIAHVIFWGDFISELPASALEVHIALSCAITLSAWVMISVFDVLVVTGLSLESVCGLGNAVTTLWGAFSGTVLLVGTIPAILKAVTYSSPHYWATFFGLRVLLDGLDLSASCEHSSSVYCASSYGDLVVHALDFHMHTTGVSALSLAGLAAAGLAALAVMVHAKGRHVRIIGGLRQPTDEFGAPPSLSMTHVTIDMLGEGGTDKERGGDGPPTLSVSRPSSTESVQAVLTE